MESENDFWIFYEADFHAKIRRTIVFERIMVDRTIMVKGDVARP